MASSAWFFYAFAAAMIWGFSYVIAEKVMKTGITPLQLFALESLISLPIILLLAEVWGGGIKQGIMTILQDKTLIVYFLLCTFCFVAASFCIFTSVSLKNATISSIIEISYPLFTIVFAWLFFKDFNLNIWSGIGAILILSGVGLIFLKS